MTTSEKVAYLKGLAEGMDIGKDNKEGKLLHAIIDILEDMALDIEDLNENALDLSEEIDELSDDLAAVEDIIYEDEDDCCCCCDDEDDDCCCCDDDYDDDCCCEDEEPLFFEVKCPACENEITIDEDVLELGAIPCPNCGANLEFEFDEDDDCCCCEDED